MPCKEWWSYGRWEGPPHGFTGVNVHEKPLDFSNALDYEPGGSVWRASPLHAGLARPMARRGLRALPRGLCQIPLLASTRPLVHAIFDMWFRKSTTIYGRCLGHMALVLSRTLAVWIPYSWHTSHGRC